jgi:hypothetical protein
MFSTMLRKRDKRNQRVKGSLKEGRIHTGIPAFGEQGFLPKGVYQVNSWESFDEHFSWNTRRRDVLADIHRLCLVLGQAGCDTLHVGGSVVSSKDRPGDFDAVWFPRGLGSVDFSLFKPDDLLHLLNEGQEKRPQHWGGHVWMAGEDVKISIEVMPSLIYPTKCEASQLLRYNRRLSPALAVGVVQLNPWRISREY